MGIAPVLERQPDFPAAIIGHAQSSFFGGRTSAHIRRLAMPVVYTDFLSMYPTVNTLMGLWKYVIARKIHVAKHCNTEVVTLLQECQRRPEMCFDPTTWPRLTAFVCVKPNGDVLPMRGKFSEDRNDWQVAINHLYGGETPNDSLWFALPDVVASVLLTGRVPEITDAFRLEARGNLSSLEPTKLRGTVDVDPAKEDFFKIVIEQRKGLGQRRDLNDVDKKRLDKALKVLANSTSYGIYAEMQRHESGRENFVRCQSIDEQPFTCRVAHPRRAQHASPTKPRFVAGRRPSVGSALGRLPSDERAGRDRLAICSPDSHGQPFNVVFPVRVVTMNRGDRTEDALPLT